MGKAPVRKELKTVDSEILSAVKSIQNAMQKQDEKISNVMSRLSDIENFNYEYGYDGAEAQEGCNLYEEEDEPVGPSLSSSESSSNGLKTERI